jgi:hypothetical protein
MANGVRRASTGGAPVNNGWTRTVRRRARHGVSRGLTAGGAPSRCGADDPATNFTTANDEGERTERRERAWGRERRARLGFYRDARGGGETTMASRRHQWCSWRRGSNEGGRGTDALKLPIT